MAGTTPSNSPTGTALDFIRYGFVIEGLNGRIEIELGRNSRYFHIPTVDEWEQVHKTEPTARASTIFIVRHTQKENGSNVMGVDDDSKV